MINKILSECEALALIFLDNLTERRVIVSGIADINSIKNVASMMFWID